MEENSNPIDIIIIFMVRNIKYSGNIDSGHLVDCF